MRYTVQNNGADSTVTDVTNGQIVFAGPYDRAVSQADELNRQASGYYNPETTALPANSTPAGPVTKTEETNISQASPPIVTNTNAASGSAESLKQPDGTYRLEIRGTETGTGNGGTGANNSNSGSAVSNPDNTGSTSDLGTIVVTAQAASKQQALPNPLHDYDSYTYCLSLHLINIADFNRLVEDPSATYIPQNVLVSSAGRYNVNFARHPAFTEDFYFDNFKMSSVINTTHRNRSSNAIECSFTLIEPNGFTFINRLLDAADSVNGYPGNYLRMPYILQIDFFGYRNGQIESVPITGQTKIIPISLVDLKSRVTHKGTEYAIRAVPFNHQAFNQTNVVSPADFLVKASTVADVFGTGVVTSTNMVAAKEEAARLEREESALKERLAAATSDRARESILEQYNTIKNTRAAQGSGAFNVSGFTDAMNDWWAELRARNQVLQVNHISVIFHPDIGEKKLYPSDSPVTVQQAASGGSTTQDQKAALQSAGGLAKNKVSFNASTMTIPAGTSIDTLIDWAVRNSEYLREQLKDPTASTTLNPNADNSSQLSKPLRWYKIVPKIKIVNFDVSTNSYTLDITYYVKPWTINSKHPLGPLGKAAGWVKEYNYMYTGKNKDILDLQIDFNMMYFNQLTSDRNKGKIFGTAKAKGDPELITESDNNPNSRGDVQQTGPVIVPQSRLQPIPVVYSSNNIKYQTRAGGSQAAAQTAGDIKESITLDSRGDMIQLKMRIIGDPHFIKQDDIFFNQNITAGQGLVTPNGSLWTDNGELYVYVLFRTPIDYDESTGLAIPANSRYNRSEWSGIYKIIKVDSEFSKGKFEQVLDLARLSISDIDLNLATTAQSRLDALNIFAVGQATTFQSTRFAGPSILQASLPGVNPANTPAATLQSGASAIQTLITGAITQAASAATGKIVGSLVKSVETTAKDAWNSVFPPTVDPKFVEGTDQFVGPVQGNGGGIDYTNAVDESAAETARLSRYNDAAVPDSLSTDVTPSPEISTDIPDVGIAPDFNFGEDFGGYENIDF